MVVPREALLLVIGLLLLAQPVVGNGPGPETQYTYEVEPVNLSDPGFGAPMYYHSAVAFHHTEKVMAVREATDGTVTRDAEFISEELQELTERRFQAELGGDEYYRVDARITNGTFKLDASPVSAHTVVEELGVSLTDAPKPIRNAVDGDVTSRTEAQATVVTDGDRALLVRVVDTESVPDRLAIVKIPAYALGVALVIYAGLSLRRE